MNCSLSKRTTWSWASGPRSDANRQIVDGNGLPVLDDGGRPIVVPIGAGNIRVTGDGGIV